MSSESESDASALENLSALTDGELDSPEAARACAAWRDDAAMRSSWHAYQLIGDVLRSDDLASTGSRDAAFLASLRERLAAEPVVLAPEPIVQPVTPVAQPAAARAASRGHGARWSWMAPSAVAAGFVLVAGALIVTRTPLPGGSLVDTTLARVGFGGATPQTVSAPTLAASESDMSPQTEFAVNTVNSKMVRDPRLESYLKAHQQFAGSSALGVPSGFLRNAAAEVPTR
jgi:sigma-E factor negative regulatory protein RseA